ncbi:carbon-nitrogen hydrolase family protein [Cognatishimia sp. SS12]|uniref:carbon-nitrogen hydrolase family protein n=1 Tax=Cognatishimia sp. SS12 TaxID=2979465 RepID=UPI00232FF2D9|nr:carbon-nitrogen hydrolase family protein [Cognatishimia sp. SS12]MDC0737704.1 carbon-nitrogen hydrolase family protein [Cognatishimia sp. SS12]
MKAALLQITSSDDPAENLEVVRAMVGEAAAAGAGYVLTPEVTNCLSGSRTHQREILVREAEDIVLAGLRAAAKAHGVWLTIGSLALRTDDADGRFANRQFLIDPQGQIAARYDKIHMFDVTVSEGETYRESAAYRPGTAAVLAKTPFATLGLTICYDLRFPALHRRLAQSGADVLVAPAAFTHVTGKAHWHALLQARAIETGCWVLAPAQTGTHKARRGPNRKTFGHSLAITPWGEIVGELGEEPGILYVDIDLKKVAQARERIPSLTHDQEFDGPDIQ